MHNMEILPPAPEGEEIASRSFWQTPTGRVARIGLLGISATGCFGFVLWGVNQFLSLRGVVNVSASRIVLVLTSVAAISGWFASTRLFRRWRNGSFLAGAAIIVLGIIFLDWWAPKPQGVQPTSPSIAEKTEPKPPDIIAVTKTEPKNPTERKIRQSIGNLVQQGTKIRDRAPVYVGEAPPDITSEWKAWAARVEKFLKGNFDSAEVAKFRSYNDPNQSLNSILHYEIGYLEALLDRVPSQGVPAVANNPAKQPQELAELAQISVEWYMWHPPSTLQQGEHIHVLQVNPGSIEGGGGFLIFSGPYTFSWPRASLQCKVTNYSEHALVDVSAELQLTVRSVVRIPRNQALYSGDVVSQNKWRIGIPKLDIGPDHAFIFYIVSSRQDIVQISFSDSATAQQVGETKRRSMRIVPVNTGTIQSLFPWG